jgi:ABC-type phosphate transport system substrate-binding protein
MKPAGVFVVHGFIVFALLIGCACGFSTTSSKSSPASPSASGVAGSGKLDPAVSMPNGFPSDFPIYPGSRLTVAGQVTANGQTT